MRICFEESILCVFCYVFLVSNIVRCFYSIFDWLTIFNHFLKIATVISYNIVFQRNFIAESLKRLYPV